MESKSYLERVCQIIPLIENGAFLTVRAAEKCNTMTIGWGLLGVCWRKPILTVAVRDSRYTFQLMETAVDFTVTMPSGNLRDEIFYCGTKSGRDVDKFTECGLEMAPGREVNSPIIHTPGLHVECKIVYKSAMAAEHLAPPLHELYPQKDFHTLYYGEVVACYETK